MKNKLQTDPNYYYEDDDLNKIGNAYGAQTDALANIIWQPAISKTELSNSEAISESIAKLKIGEKLLIPYNTMGEIDTNNYHRSNKAHGNHWVGVQLEKTENGEMHLTVLNSMGSRKNHLSDSDKAIFQQWQKAIKTAIATSTEASTIDAIEATGFETAEELAQQNLDARNRNLKIKTALEKFTLVQKAPTIEVWQQKDASSCGAWTMENLRRQGYKENENIAQNNHMSDLALRKHHDMLLNNNNLQEFSKAVTPASAQPELKKTPQDILISDLSVKATYELKEALSTLAEALKVNDPEISKDAWHEIKMNFSKNPNDKKILDTLYNKNLRPDNLEKLLSDAKKYDAQNSNGLKPSATPNFKNRQGSSIGVRQ